MTDDATKADASDTPRARAMGLSGKLLVLTILFVMIAEVLIYVPSIANFRLNWLKDRLAAAHTAALVLEPGSDRVVSDALVRRVLDSIGAKAVALKMGNQRHLLALSENPPMAQQEVDMRDVSSWDAIMGAFETIFMSRDSDVLRAVGPAPMGGDFVEIVLGDGAAAAGDAALLRQRAAAVADHFRDHRGAGLFRAALSAGAADAAHHRQHDGVPRRPGKSVAHHRAVGAAATRSASPSASSRRCRATLPRCCTRRAGSRRSASRCRRSTTTCATCSPRRNCSRKGCRICPIRACSVSRRS